MKMVLPRKYKWIEEGLGRMPLTMKLTAMKRFAKPPKEYLPEGKYSGNVEDLVSCALCPNMCRFDCPISESSRTRQLSPSGKAGIVYMLLDGTLDGSEEVYDVAYQCCICNACKMWCPFGFSLGEVLKGLHVDMVKKGFVPEPVTKVKDELVSKHTLDERVVDIGAKEKGEVLYFIGCTTSTHGESVALSMKRVMDAAGEDFAVLKDEWCCGAPLVNFGYIDEFKEFARHQKQAIKESGCKKVVCGCPTCAYMLSEVYKEHGVDLEVPVQHSSVYLQELLEAGRIKCKALPEEYVYHDPCSLVRKLEHSGAPRDVFDHIPELKMHDAYYGGKDTQCCGRGSGLGRTYPDIAQKQTIRRIEDLKRECEKIATACPTCKKAFTDEGCEVADIVEIVAAALEE